LLQMNYVVNTDDERQKFIIPNAGADYEHLRVTVQDSQTSTTKESYLPAENFLDVDPENNAYWTWEVDNQLYEIEFGDGILAKKLKNNNFVTVDYLVSSAGAANGANNFRIAGAVEGLSDVVVVTANKAFGGSEVETLDSIKFNAPRAYAYQNRGVIEADYQFLVKREFPSADSVVVWGGEKEVPPQFGKVFMSIVPSEGFELTPIEKEFIVNTLIKRYNIVSIIPEIIDPEFTFIKLKTDALYNAEQTVKSNGEIQVLIENTITDFNENFLRQFAGDYRHSQLVCAINDTDPAITSNITSVILEKRFTPLIDIIAQYTLEFNDSIEPESIYMDGFTVADTIAADDTTSYKMIDDGLGALQVVRVREDQADFIMFQSGLVDYETGHVEILNFTPLEVEEEDEESQPLLRMTAVPVDNDVQVDRHNVLEISEYFVDVQPNEKR